MEAKEIYLKIKREITKGLYAYDDQIAAIAKWVESEFEEKKQGEKLPIHNVMYRLPPVTLLEKVNRVEVIDQNGRSYVNWKPTNKTELSLQDDGKTLKVFISN